MKTRNMRARRLLEGMLALLISAPLAGPALAAPGNVDWPMHGHDASAQRYSALDQIDRGNVSRLVPAWTYHSGVSATFQATPIVVDGIMYLSLPFSHVVALDGRTGRPLWRYEHKRGPSRLCCGPSNRGVAVTHGMVFVGTVDAHLVALDAKTGRPLWNVEVAARGRPTESVSQLAADDPVARQAQIGSSGVGIAMAPQVFENLVIIGITGVGYGLHSEKAVVGFPGSYGGSGVLAAFDIRNGRRVWQFNVTGPGWEGQYRARTPDGVDLHRDIAAERAAAPAFADAWRYGGGSLWATPAIDVVRGMIFFGTGNPSPQLEDSSRPGDNLYTSSLVALDARTGKLIWHYQQVPHDRWGYDVASPPILFELERDGKKIPALAMASKMGWVYVHDRRDGHLLYRSDPFVPQENLFALPTAAGVVIAPGAFGGASWSPGALDPGSLVMFQPAVNMPTRYSVREGTRPDGTRYQYDVVDLESVRRGTLTAIDLAHDGHFRWQLDMDEPMVGGVLATAGHLVFTGVGHDDFAALDSASGRRLWTYHCEAGVNAPPITYAIDGRQYVAVAAGGNALLGLKQGDTLQVFALPE